MIKIDTRSKFKMAAVAILAKTWSLLQIFAPNLKQWLKMGSRSQIYHQNSHTMTVSSCKALVTVSQQGH